MHFTYFIHLIPLVLGFSLVYAGTRCEDVPSIIRQGLRSGMSIFLFLLGSFLVLSLFWGF